MEKQPEIKDRRKKTTSNTIFRHSDIVVVLGKEKCTILWRNFLCIVEEGVNTMEQKLLFFCTLENFDTTIYYDNLITIPTFVGPPVNQ